jgi:hypothetical protein
MPVDEISFKFRRDFGITHRESCFRGGGDVSAPPTPQAVELPMDISLNSFALIFGHCVWVPASPKAALVALSLFCGIGISDEPNVRAAEISIAGQYVAASKSQPEADKEMVRLNACFATYEVPPEKQDRPRNLDPEQPFKHAQAPSGH